jgi:hypothetical protein
MRVEVTLRLAGFALTLLLRFRIKSNLVLRF